MPLEYPDAVDFLKSLHYVPKDGFERSAAAVIAFLKEICAELKIETEFSKTKDGSIFVLLMGERFQILPRKAQKEIRINFEEHDNKKIINKSVSIAETPGRSNKAEARAIIVHLAEMCAVLQKLP